MSAPHITAAVDALVLDIQHRMAAVHQQRPDLTPEQALDVTIEIMALEVDDKWTTC